MPENIIINSVSFKSKVFFNYGHLNAPNTKHLNGKWQEQPRLNSEIHPPEIRKYLD